MPDISPIPDDHDERWVTRSAACFYLSCSEGYLDNLIRSGALPAYKMGTRAVRLRVSDLRSLLVEHKDPA